MDVCPGNGSDCCSIRRKLTIATFGFARVGKVELFDEADSVPNVTWTASFDTGTSVSTPVNVRVVALSPVPSTTELPNDVQAGAARQLNTPDVESWVVPNTMGSAAAPLADASSRTVGKRMRGLIGRLLVVSWTDLAGAIGAPVRSPPFGRELHQSSQWMTRLLPRHGNASAK
jgi:hypothetical protein